MRIIFLPSPGSAFGPAIYDVEVEPERLLLWYCCPAADGEHTAVFSCPYSISNSVSIVSAVERNFSGHVLRVGCGFSAEDDDWHGYVGHYVVEGIGFARQNVYVDLRAVGPSLEEARVSLERFKAQNPYDAEIQDLKLSVVANICVELKWFDTHKITLEADYEQR